MTPIALGNTVIVEHLPDTPQSSVLHIPETAEGSKTSLVQAKVCSVGNRDFCIELKPGDTVLVPRHFGSRINGYNDKQYIVYDNEDIVAIVR